MCVCVFVCVYARVDTHSNVSILHVSNEGFVIFRFIISNFANT